MLVKVKLTCVAASDVCYVTVNSLWQLTAVDVCARTQRHRLGSVAASDVCYVTVNSLWQLTAVDVQGPSVAFSAVWQPVMCVISQLTVCDSWRLSMCVQGPSITVSAVISIIFWFRSYSHESHSAHHYLVVTTTAITWWRCCWWWWYSEVFIVLPAVRHVQSHPY